MRAAVDVDGALEQRQTFVRVCLHVVDDGAFGWSHGWLLLRGQRQADRRHERGSEQRTGGISVK